MKEFYVKDIPYESFFSSTVYLDSSFVLTAPEIPFSKKLSAALEKWSFNTVESFGEPRKEYSAGQKSSEAAESGISMQAEDGKIKKAEEFYAAFKHAVDFIYKKVEIANELDYKHVADQIKNAVDFIREDHRFLMRVLKNVEPEATDNYLTFHSMRSTIISIIIGLNLKLPVHRMIELGIASVLHEIGMIKLPPQTYLNQRPLNAQEQKAILTHPILGYTMLKSYDFPLVTCLAALEHHERENGSGYPRHLAGDKISLYSKIIAVACSYEALSSKRPHKEAKDGYTGMIELLKNEGKRYNDTVVRALVHALSLYPIGLYVMLSNGKKGQVIDVNPEDPRYPIVQFLDEFTPDGKNKVVKTSANNLTITRPLNRTEIES
jgi:HD-GYP domain-containing protein (c-di-GMP phosphodiesterase class II)